MASRHYNLCSRGFLLISKLCDAQEFGLKEGDLLKVGVPLLAIVQSSGDEQDQGM